MRESQYTAAVAKLLPPEVYALKLSLPYTAGVPDSWYSGRGGDLWVEWKYLKSVPRKVNLVDGKKPILSALQQLWLRERHAEGRNVAVIVGTPDGAVIYPGEAWREELTREQFYERLVTRREAAAWIASMLKKTIVV